MVNPFLAYVMLNKCSRLGGTLHFKSCAVLWWGNTTFEHKRFAEAIYMIPVVKFMQSLCVVSPWRNNTFSMHMLTRRDQWVTQDHRENQENQDSRTNG